MLLAETKLILAPQKVLELLEVVVVDLHLPQ
jgi:hypothetical protein